MKSQLNERLLNIALGVLTDCQVAYPMAGLGRDQKRLTLLSETRGLGFFTLDLPGLDKVLLDGLKNGRLRPSGHLCKKVSRKRQVPAFLQGLWLRVFDGHGVLKPDVDPTAIAFLRQIFCLGKNVVAACTPQRINKAVKEYIYVDRELPEPSLDWNFGNLDYYGKSGSDRSFSDGYHSTHPTTSVCHSAEEEQQTFIKGLLDHDTLESRSTTFVNVPGFRITESDGQEETLRLREAHPPGSFGPRNSPCVSKHMGEMGSGDGHVCRNRQTTSPTVVASLISLQKVCDEMMDLFPVFHPIAYSDYRYEYHGDIGFKHGPGAVADCGKKFDKYEFPSWSDKLESFFPYRHCINDDRIETSPTRTEHPSKLIAVPKTAKTPRLIASEPTSFMWAQQLIRCFLVEYISYSPLAKVIDFSRQDLSREMARRASRTGELATVDLSAASDRLSCWAVERMFRKHPTLLHALHACRTSHVSINIGGVTELLRKKKFASQGSAVTFPVQTLFFMACVLAVMPGRTIAEKIKKSGRSIRAFGDDLIIPKGRYAELRELLETLSLKVNDDKSFASGDFRESCGFDGFQGYDVTPIKPKTLSSDGPESRVSNLDFSNNLFNKGYWNATVAAESTLRVPVYQVPVVGRDSGAIGRTSYCGDDYSHLKQRWNPHLQRREVRVRGFTSRIRRESTNGNPALLRFFAEYGGVRRANAPYTNGYMRGCHARDGMTWVNLPVDGLFVTTP